MSQILGQQIVVENKGGAASSIAGAYVARAPKDGYTLYVNSAANMINAAMSSTLNFDIMKDFSPITLITSTPTVLVVTPELGVKTVKELIALAKDEARHDLVRLLRRRQLDALALELFNAQAGVKITHIPYTGSPQVVTDLLANRIHGYFSPASTVMGHVQAGKLVALAVTDPKRSTFMPRACRPWPKPACPIASRCCGSASPRPRARRNAIIDKLSRAANEALKEHELIKSLNTQTVEVLGGYAGDTAQIHRGRAEALERSRRKRRAEEVASRRVPRASIRAARRRALRRLRIVRRADRIGE